MFFQKYTFGDAELIYREVPVEGREGATTVGLAVYPKRMRAAAEKLMMDSLVQAAFTGDEAVVDYSEGVTMRNHSSTILKFEGQTSDMGGVQTMLSDDAGNFYTHILRYDKETGVFTSQVVYRNLTEKIQTLERLDSFSLSGIGDAQTGNTEGFCLSRMTSAWSRECRLRKDTFSSLGLDMSWARYGVKVEAWGQNGSMPNRGYFPFGAIEGAGYCLAAMLEAPYSWQLEVYKERESCSFSGGLADYERGHWRKEILPGETFSTGLAYFTVQPDLTAACNALVAFQDGRLEVPACEETMPVLFNEYCTTWGCPSEENIQNILSALEGLPIGYFVIDCGWFKPEGKGWCNAIGDWQVSGRLFPEGLGRVAQTIRAAGKLPGIWFEFENAGRDSEAFWREELLLKRDGRVITSKNRRFLDLRLEETEDYLDARMTRLLKESGFGYIKIDYNDTYGIGCDSEDGAAPAEGGREVAEASLGWLEKLKEAVPGLVIENCSSGGSRIEPKRMSMVSMCSFSDAHECNEIPLVAANVSRVIPARQSQIWAVLRENEPDSRTVYSLTAAMMGRICLSGDVLGLTPAKRELIRRGLAFYGQVKEIVKCGKIVRIDSTVEYYRDPKGRQVYEKAYRDKLLVIVHYLECEEETVCAAGYRLLAAYTDLGYTMSADGLHIFGKQYHGGAFLLEEAPRA